MQKSVTKLTTQLENGYKLVGNDYKTLFAILDVGWLRSCVAIFTPPIRVGYTYSVHKIMDYTNSRGDVFLYAMVRNMVLFTTVFKPQESGFNLIII